MSAIELIRELLHHTQQETYKERAEEVRRGGGWIHKVDGEQKKRGREQRGGEGLMSGPPWSPPDEK